MSFCFYLVYYLYTLSLDQVGILPQTFQDIWKNLHATSDLVGKSMYVCFLACSPQPGVEDTGEISSIRLGDTQTSHLKGYFD